MHPQDIIALLHKAGHPPSQVARELDVAQSSVSIIIHNKGKSRNIATYISAITNTPLNTLWPDTYNFKHNRSAV